MFKNWFKKLTALVALTAVGFALFAEKPQTASSASISLTLGTTVVSEGDDFSTRGLGLPWWNLNGPPYPDTFTAMQNIDEAAFSVTPDGFWDIRSVTNDPTLWLSWTGIDNTQRVLKMGDTHPIDASRYSLLSYYMCVDNAPSPTDYAWGANVYWFYDRIPYTDPGNGISEYLLFVQQGRFKNDGDCELITFNLSDPSIWMTGSWNNNPRKPIGLRLDPVNQPNVSYQLGWVRLTSKDTTNIVPMNWSGAPAGTNRFFVSLTACGQDGVLVGRKSGSSGTFNWGQQLISGFSSAHPLPLPESFEPGSYYLYMMDSNDVVTCAANNPLKIQAAPILDFQKPSFQSGPDFALQNLGNAWGMADNADIERYINVASASFSNGLLNFTANSIDPQLYMNLDGQTIPTNSYRYASFRFRINGKHVQGSGWVQRWLWWYNGGPGVDHVTTQDMNIYEGLKVYTIDLETAPLEDCSGDCWSGTPKVLRFDPYETVVPSTMVLDYVLLTGPEKITRGEIFPIYYTTTAGNGASITFYYDSDTNPANGRTLIGSVTKGQALEALNVGPFNVFVPYAPGGDLSEIRLYDLSSRFAWDTTGVPRSTFYISADVSDGITLTTWYSELPVTIQ